MESVATMQQQHQPDIVPGETERQRRLRLRRMERTKQKEESEKKMEELQELYIKTRQPEDANEGFFQRVCV
jgi:hypothetical protein